MCIVNKGIASLIQKVLNNNNWAILKTARGQKWESAAQLNEKRWFSLEFISWQNYCTECKYLSRSTIGCLRASISKQKAEVTNQRSDWWPKGWENCGRVSPHTTLCLTSLLICTCPACYHMWTTKKWENFCTVLKYQVNMTELIPIILNWADWSLTILWSPNAYCFHHTRRKWQ